MLKQIDTYDWREAFEYANPDAISPAGVLQDNVDTSPYGVEDVAVIHHLDEGYNDGPPWIGVFELKDGRFAFLTAWCDYTGWD